MLVSALGTRVQIACHHDHAHALVVVCNGAAMKLRLMEQACGCSLLVFASGTRAENACGSDHRVGMMDDQHTVGLAVDDGSWSIIFTSRRPKISIAGAYSRDIAMVQP